MGLDQRLLWIGKPSKDMVARLHNENISGRYHGMNYLKEESFDNPRYKNILKYLVMETVYFNEYDFNAVKKHCGKTEDAHICSIGQNKIGFGKAVNVDGVEYFDVNWNDYIRPFKYNVGFYMDEELYRWRNNYEVQDIFDEAYPDEWCEYKNKNTMLDCGIYKVTTKLLNKIKKVDSNFSYTGSTKNLYYNADW